MGHIETVLVTGGAGYVGAVTVPKLLNAGYKVRVLDLFLYGEAAMAHCRAHPAYSEIKGDLRDPVVLERALKGVDAVIHLACISNDPSFELDPALGKSINYDAFRPLVRAAKESGVRRFVFASSSSVYGLKSEEQVTEELACEPLTDYSRFKAMCEAELLDEATDEFTCLILRPATVCGNSPRLRLDLTVNILTNHAVNKHEILVFGGRQQRPNIHIDDISDLYVETLRYPHERIHKKIFNVGFENQTIDEIAEIVRDEIGNEVRIKHVPTDDNRSYRITSSRIERELGYRPKRTIRDAVKDLCGAFDRGEIPDSFTDPRYFNIKTMQLAGLK